LASLRYDSKANALYLRVAEGSISLTEPLSDSVFIDLGKKGELLGIEFILPKDVPKKTISKIAAKAAAK
jgi:uncharacterized protein YuzE